MITFTVALARAHSRLLHLREIRFPRLRRRSETRDSGLHQTGRSRLHSDAGVENLHDPVPEYRGPRSHIRSDHGSQVRHGFLPVDRTGQYLRRSRARFSLGHDLAPQRRRKPARDDRPIPRKPVQAVHADLLGAADGTGRRRIRGRTGRPARQADAGQSRSDVLGDRRIRLLRTGHAAADRQDHRQDLSSVRHRTDIHGCRNTRHAFLASSLPARTDRRRG